MFQKSGHCRPLGILVGSLRSLTDFTGISLWLATFYYALQISCDFSGYTDMAIGISRLLGINLTINFNKPYLAVSIPDFGGVGIFPFFLDI